MAIRKKYGEATLQVGYLVDLSKFNVKMEELKKNAKSTGPIMQGIGQVMKREALKCFDNEESPDGVKWQQLSFERLKRKPPGLKILEEHGTLRNSLHSRSTNTSAWLESDCGYAEAHNNGNENLPQRQFAAITKMDKILFKDKVKTGLIRRDLLEEEGE
jgi:phage virion morphogenesis protein